ncbi:glycosyltransferase family 4 protein [Rhizohabitans arisaemae]|uniref:glycosyltransferase family 4 protein n=1 Tax=Rhizohabitans arisaemae TaxID=2720610 RepID=UPI0024B0D24C|nr:glycosyltransferase family 4 protein [Rhizohabitans arisaemae]
MRILHVSDCFLPRLGGIEVQVGDLVRAQREAGHHVEVATATPGDSGHGVHRITARIPFDLPLHPRGGHHLRRLYAARRPDVVHVHLGAVSPFSWTAVRTAVRAGLPTVVTVHSMWDPVTRAVYRLLDLLTGWTRWPLLVTTVSEAASRPIRAVAGPRIPVRVVSNGLDVDAWRPVRATTPPAASAASPVHIVAVGRLAPRKQPVRLLKLMRTARSRVPGETPLRVTVVGDGPAKGAMERYLRANAMSDWVALPGRFTREQIKELLASADVFVAPAPRESFGLAALEARTAGLPVVARTQSGVADFVESGQEGLLGGSFEQLAAAIARLARDPALRRRIQAHNRETAPVDCTWPAVIEAFDDTYVQATTRTKSHRSNR